MGDFTTPVEAAPELQHEARAREAAARPKPPAELDQGQLIERMEEAIRGALLEYDEENAPRVAVQRLLALQAPGGRKLVFTRFEMFQVFALWTRKLVGEEPLSG